jgi:hypothetical protein
MRSNHAPVLAAWLVDRFCGEPAVAGDLIEEFREGHSSVWFWRQSLIAILACSSARIWDHKWLTIRAVTMGFLFAWIVIRIGMKEIVHPWWDAVAPPAWYPAIALLPWLVNGWLIGRLHRPYSLAMVLAYAVWLVIRSAPPVYDAAVDAFTGVGAGALAFELWSRASSLLIMICGGVLSSTRLVPRRSSHRAWKSHRIPAASAFFGCRR